MSKPISRGELVRRLSRAISSIDLRDPTAPITRQDMERVHRSIFPNGNVVAEHFGLVWYTKTDVSPDGTIVESS